MKTIESTHTSAADRSEVVTIDEVIQVLERAPSKDEVFQALNDLRRDRLKGAISESVKAAKFDRKQAVEEFLIDRDRGPHTRTAYRLALGKLFAYVDLMGLSLLGLTRSDANKFRKWLEERPATNRGGKLKPNSQRVTLAAISAFWKYLEVVGLIQTNPWAGIALPQREFKHRPKVESDESAVPVMTDQEYQIVLADLVKRSQMEAITSGQSRMRDSAKRLYPFVLLLGETGLRLGDALTMKLAGDGRASFRVKGGAVRTIALPTTVADHFKTGPLRPFSSWNRESTGEAVGRLCRNLYSKAILRHPYTAHDFRHRFAARVYRETRDVLAVQASLGHSSVAVSQIYLQGLGEM